MSRQNAFATKSQAKQDARENARIGMQAIMRLEEITGIPAFPRVRSSKLA